MKKNTIYITLDVNLNQIHSVTLKQYNKKSQWLMIKVTQDGKPFHFDENDLCIFKMRTPDGCEIYNDAVIADSSVVVEITQNCCASLGHGEAELNIIKRIDEETSSQIATMNLSIVIEKSVYSEEDIEGSSEYKSLTDRIVKADSVIAKVREIIETTSSAAAEASDSADIAKAKAQEAVNAAASANESEENARYASLNAADSAEQSKESARNAEMDAQSALISAEDANNWAVEANNAMWMAKEHLNAALEYQTEAESYAHGGTHCRENEDVDNARFYYEQSKSISESFSGALRPMGTVTFTNLPDLSNAVEGDMYNISNEFVTTTAFREGRGYTYPAGTNIYKTADGYWDCLAGTPVTGVKGNKETTYRKGNVNLTPANIGAASSEIISNGDFNSMTTPGLYTMRSTTANAPTSSSYHSLIVLRSDTGIYVQQIAIREGTADVYARYGTSSFWGSWVKLMKSGETVGSATKATQDGSGNVITNTYIKKSDWLNLVYPIGAIYMSVNSTNPSTLFGGTWAAWGSGRVPVGINTSETEFNTVEKTGGEKAHVLTTNEMPAHNHIIGAHAHGLNDHIHSIPPLSGSTSSAGTHSHDLTYETDTSSGSARHRVVPNGSGSYTGSSTGTKSAGAHTHTVTTNVNTTGASSGNTKNSEQSDSGSAGSGNAHNNLQPYITCYMWKRTA